MNEKFRKTGRAISIEVYLIINLKFLNHYFVIMERYRNILKELVKFEKREYQEKKPNTVKILRIKDLRILTLGSALKTFSIRQPQNPHFIVLVEYKEHIRIYLFTKEVMLLEGINQEKDSKFLNELKKGVIIEYKLPKRNQ